MDPSTDMTFGEGSTLSVTQRHVKNRHSREEWEQQKELIERLYLDEDKTVEETLLYLKENKGFIVGERKFKMQLKEWGFDKNIKFRHAAHAGQGYETQVRGGQRNKVQI